MQSASTTQTPTHDLERNDTMSVTETTEEIDSEPHLDIEHIPVENDPRKWSSARKNLVLGLVASGSLIAGFSANIQNPAIQDMEASLPATDSQISLSVSLFILMQGSAPLLWSAVSEVKGRRFVYLVSLSIYIIGTIVVAVSKSIGLVIGMRILQAAGSSAVMSIGAASLADVFEPAERGTKMGIYYISPLLGPSLAPIIGGALTSGFNWRAIFCFLAIVGGVVLLGFLFFFRDTFRKERSAAYQALLKHRLKEQAQKARAEKDMRVSGKEAKDYNPDSATEKPSAVGTSDLEKQVPAEQPATIDSLMKDPTLKITLKDVTPIKPLWLVLRRWNNCAMLFASGLIFAYCFAVVYTTSRTLGNHYGYDALKIGLVLLSFGVGNVAGSLVGGRWSDIQLARLKEKNGGKSYPEMRLQSTFYMLWIFPISVVGLAWVCQRHANVAAICIMLFVSGFLVISIYSSTLAYIVDANVGRSSSAVALNSFFRGLSAFLATEIAVPVQDALGDGWMYTLFAIALLLSSSCIYITMKKGEEWRTKAEATEKK